MKVRQIVSSALNRTEAEVRKHPVLALIAAAALLFAIWHYGSGLVALIRHAFENSTVNQLEKKADESQKQAAEQLKQANEAAIERQAEDLNRQKTITPEIERTTRNVNEARERTRKAQNNYEKAKSDLGNDNSDLRDLHERNCTDLRELYPDEAADFCVR